MASTQDEIDRREYLREHRLDDPNNQRQRDERHDESDQHDDSPAAIERDIRRTRADMDHTIEELQDRLSPRHLMDDVSRFFKKRKARKRAENMQHEQEHSDEPGTASKVAKKIGSGLWQTVRNHPVPAVLATTALTTLIYESASGNSKDSRRRQRRSETGGYQPPMHSGSYVFAQTGQPYQQMGQQPDLPFAGRQSSQHHEQERGMMQQAGEGARSMASKASEGVSHVGQSMRSSAQHMRDSASSAGGRVSKTMKHGYEQAKHSMEQSKNFIEERPVTVGLGVLALGLLVGLLLPRSQREDDIMGEQSDELMQQGREKGRDLYERGKDVASETVESASETAKEESRKQGLAPDQ